MDTVSWSRPRVELEDLKKIRFFLEHNLLAHQVSGEDRYALIFSVNEMVTNILVHGYQGRGGKIEIDLTLNEKAISVRIRDQAPLFDPTQMGNPDLTLPLLKRPSGGLGVYMTRQYLDAIRYSVGPGDVNELTLVKNV